MPTVAYNGIYSYFNRVLVSNRFGISITTFAGKGMKTETGGGNDGDGKTTGEEAIEPIEIDHFSANSCQFIFHFHQ